MDEKEIWVTLETGAVILIEKKITARGMGNRGCIRLNLHTLTQSEE